MARKNSLRKQVEALEALAGLESLTPTEAQKTNGGLAVGGSKKLIKTKKSTGALVARGTGALWRGGKHSGALRWVPSLGG